MLTAVVEMLSAAVRLAAFGGYREGRLRLRRARRHLRRGWERLKTSGHTRRRKQVTACAAASVQPTYLASVALLHAGAIFWSCSVRFQLACNQPHLTPTPASSGAEVLFTKCAGKALLLVRSKILCCLLLPLLFAGLSLLEPATAPADTADPLAAMGQPISSASAPPTPPPPQDSTEQHRKRTFALLQPICSALLLQRADPQRMADMLTGGGVVGPATGQHSGL